MSLDSIFSNSSDIALCAFSFPFPWIRPKFCAVSAHLRFALPAVRYSTGHTFDYTVILFGPSAKVAPCLLWPLLTSHSSLLLRLLRPPVRPHGISRQSFLVYLPDLRLRVTVAFWTSLPHASLSAVNALISGFCSSGYDFAIPSSRLHLAIQTLGVALGFVGNYAPRGLSPQTDGMPVIHNKGSGKPDPLKKSDMKL